MTQQASAHENSGDHEVYVFLTTEDEMAAWLAEPWEEAKKLQRPLPKDKLMIANPPDVPE